LWPLWYYNIAALPDLYEKKRKISGPVLTDISKHSTVLKIEKINSHFSIRTHIVKKKHKTDEDPDPAGSRFRPFDIFGSGSNIRFFTASIICEEIFFLTKNALNFFFLS
jgi:hypothetical protein